MKNIITQAMAQNFSSHAVFGRVLFGVAFLALGLYSILNAKMFGSYVPGFIPEILAPVITFLVGIIFTGAGFGIATGRDVARSSISIALVWIAIALFTNLFSGYFDIREFFIALGFVGASLVIKASSEGSGSAVESAKHHSEFIKPTHKEQDAHDMHR